MSTVRAFSAPGKALIAGGYLVLDPAYNAYVTALSCRMHAVIESREVPAKSKITIDSPQFGKGHWVYEMKDEEFRVEQVEGDLNPFVGAAVETILKYVEPRESFNYHITIYSDAGYHTQQDTRAVKSGNGAKQFLYHLEPIGQVAKTGLGSSAGLVSVITGSLLSVFKKSSLDEIKDKIHNLAQISHCYAQKKVGSGFDVAAAIYGSIIYRRFHASVIDEYFQNPKQEKLQEIVNNQWDFKHVRCALPPGIKLLMGDISGGSETPKLVSKVLKWKNEDPNTSKLLYENLNSANMSLVNALDQLHKEYEENESNYRDNLNKFSTNSIISSNLQSLVNSLHDIRQYLKKLTNLTGADIEPELQTILLDACFTLPGCFGGVVPGAGGFDAISLLVVESKVDQILNQTMSESRFSNVSWLNLHEEAEGILEENPADYKDLSA